MDLPIKLISSKPISEFQGNHRWLSNFWPLPYGAEYAGIVYPSSEHAYVAAKTDDVEVRRKIAATVSPGAVKRIGRTILLRDGWHLMKLDVMHEIIKSKFERNPDLMQLLIETGVRELIEGNDWGDTFWGVCNGKGTNHLGRLLMAVRRKAAGLDVNYSREVK